MKAVFATLISIICLASAMAELVPVRGPEIILDRASADIFPESWRGGKIDATAKLLPETERTRCRGIVEQALRKYPRGLLEATLRKVHGLGHLQYHGIVTGGTRSSGVIYVVCKPHFSSAGVESIVHAEYSSILFQKFPQHFAAEAWQRLNPPGFQYFGSGVEAVRDGRASKLSDSALYEQGFFHQYAQASIEEDFNSHVARLFMGDERYGQAVEQYPRLKAKSKLVMDFYAKVDVSFTEAWFVALRQDGSKVVAGENL